MVGHADNMIKHVALEEERQRMRQFLDNPAPKLGHGWAVAGEVDFLTYKRLPGQLGYSEIKGGGESPVSVRFFTMNTAFALNDGEKYTDYLRRLAKINREAREDLQAMGCVVASFTHESKSTDPTKDTRQSCLAVPHVVISGDKTRPEYDRQVRGAGIFIAYLMAKGYAQEGELSEAFGEQFVAEAKKPDIQGLVAKLLTEGRDAVSPLPSAEIIAASRRFTQPDVPPR
jgi:hypothetical protein